MEEFGQIEVTEECLTDTEIENVVDGKYTRPQVYWVPYDEPDEETGTQEFLRFTIQTGCTVEEGKDALTQLAELFDMTYDEFMEAFGFEDEA